MFQPKNKLVANSKPKEDIKPAIPEEIKEEIKEEVKNELKEEMRVNLAQKEQKIVEF